MIGEIKQQVMEKQQSMTELSVLYLRLANEITTLKNKYNRQQLFFPLDADSRKLITDLIAIPITVNLKNTEPATAVNYGLFFTADRPYNVIGITEVHGTAGTDASAVSLQIERLQGTEALTAGKNSP